MGYAAVKGMPLRVMCVTAMERGRNMGREMPWNRRGPLG
jgi:hypothetical protein